MPSYTIIVTNDLSGCTETISETITVTGCTNYFIRIPSDSTADGPFNIYTGSTSTTPIFSAVTKEELYSGVTYSFLC